MYRLTIILALVALLLGGCGGSSGPGPQRVQPAQVQPADAIRSALESIARTGEVGSEGLTIQENIERLRASDPAKADALSKDYEELQRASDPGKVKSVAAQMLQKL